MDIYEQYKQYFRLGWCKICRQWDVLSDKYICFSCLGLTLKQKFPELFSKKED
jgi:hypothetical protein